MNNNIMNSSCLNSGYLEIILGSMYSGKSSRLVEIYKQCNFCNIPVMAINHVIDNRYDNNLLSTHDKIKIPCIKSDLLKNIWPSDELLSADVILINEGQFFSDIVETVLELVEKQKKRVYICGLDGDFKRERIGNLLDLIPHCDEISKLKSLCSECKDGTHGIFSFRTTDEKDQVVIGSDIYKPLCRSCYNTLSLNKYM